MAVRRDNEMWRHSRAALSAEATTSSTSSVEARWTVLVCSPVAGLKTGEVRCADPVTWRPFIQ